MVGPKFTVRPTFRCDVKWPGVTLAVAPSDRQRSDQPLYVAHSRFHRTGVLIGESRGRDLERERPTGRPGSAWSTVGEVCPETSRRLGGMRTLATARSIRRDEWSRSVPHWPFAETGDPVQPASIRTTNAGKGFQGSWRPTALAARGKLPAHQLSS